MHVLQWIAVKQNMPFDLEEIDSCKEEAHANVKSTFEDMWSESEGLGGWSDWYIVGGGRWNENSDPYMETDYSMVVSYGAEPDKFIETIMLLKSVRMSLLPTETALRNRTLISLPV